MKIEPGTTQNGRAVKALVILLPLLVAATKLLPDLPVIDATDLLGNSTSALLAHVLATLSLARTVLGAQRSALVSDWCLRRMFGKRIAERFRAAPALGDLIVNACQALRTRKGGLQRH